LTAFAVPPTVLRMRLQPVFLLGPDDAERAAEQRRTNRRAILVTGLTGLVGLAAGFGISTMTFSASADCGTSAAGSTALLEHLQRLLAATDGEVLDNAGLIVASVPSLNDTEVLQTLVRRLGAAAVAAGSGKGRVTAQALQQVAEWPHMREALQPHTVALRSLGK
jgi:hypothetical protein